MHRTVAFLLLIGLLAGCTRYGTNPPGGPFARKPKTDADTTIPPAPAANNSPLAMGTMTPAAVAVDESSVVPPRLPEPLRLVGGDSTPPAVIPTSATFTSDGADSSPPWRRPLEAAPDQMPSPFAKDAAAVVSPGATRAAAVAASPAPAGPSAAAVNIAEVKKLAVAAAEKWTKVSTYEAIVTRRELIPTREMSSDLVFYQYRKEPMSVFIKNIGDSGKGRELIYNSKTDKIHVMLGEGDHKLMPAGFKAPAVTPDDPRVKDKSRYSIRDAGYGTPINKLNQWVAKAESGRILPDALRYMGQVERKEYPYPLIGVMLKLRPGDEPTMPNGGMRQWFIDPRPESGSYSWPVLIIATEPSGKEVEYYLFEKVKLNVRLTDADFAPERLGKK